MILAALFTIFGPVTFVKTLFRLFHSLWKTKLSFSVTVCGVQICAGFIYSFSHSCFELRAKVIRLAMAESIQNSCKLLTSVEMSQGDTNKNVLADFPSSLRSCATNILADGVDKTFCPFTFFGVRFISTENKVEEPLQLLWKFFS